ncbi:Gfo/Idh/MocA family protein [Chitinimonas viridis]|nr:Gfo/Idh/MocA family oxidoreductase [Chitinimonas viridis]
MTILQWGILGTGGIASQLARAMAELADARLYAVASREAAKAASFAQTFGAARHYGSYAELVADPAVDAVYIATPHAQHFDALQLCLAAGKPVLCEKPFTLNAQQAAQAIALAGERQVFMMEAMWMRFIPAIAQAQALVASGAIGQLQGVHADFGFLQPFDPTHRVFNPALGGGALLDIGIYPLSLACLFLGPIARIQSMAELGTTGVDEQTAFTLQHAGGGLSTGWCSLRAPSPTEAILLGSQGTLRLHAPFYCPSRLTLQQQGQAPRTISVPISGNGYRYELEEVHRCLGLGLLESPRMPLADTLATLQALDTIRAQIGVRHPGE